MDNKFTIAIHLTFCHIIAVHIRPIICIIRWFFWTMTKQWFTCYSPTGLCNDIVFCGNWNFTIITNSNFFRSVQIKPKVIIATSTFITPTQCGCRSGYQSATLIGYCRPTASTGKYLKAVASLRCNIGHAGNAVSSCHSQTAIVCPVWTFIMHTEVADQIEVTAYAPFSVEIHVFGYSTTVERKRLCQFCILIPTCRTITVCCSYWGNSTSICYVHGEVRCTIIRVNRHGVRSSRFYCCQRYNTTIKRESDISSLVDRELSRQIVLSIDRISRDIIAVDVEFVRITGIVISLGGERDSYTLISITGAKVHSSELVDAIECSAATIGDIESMVTGCQRNNSLTTIVHI